MQVRIFDTPEQLSKEAARIVAAQIRRKPNSVLGFPTGSTPLSMYAELVRLHEEEGLDFSGVINFNMDEYVGLTEYHEYMRQNLVSKVNIDERNVHIPDGLAENLDAICEEYEVKIRQAGGIDLQVCGIGINAHIAFNEPGTPFDSVTHVVELMDETLTRNFGNAKTAPTQYAITIGLKTIMDARSILLLAIGQDKAEAIRNAIEGPVTEAVPASILQRHKHVTVLLDQAAAAKLSC